MAFAKAIRPSFDPLGADFLLKWLGGTYDGCDVKYPVMDWYYDDVSLFRTSEFSLQVSPPAFSIWIRKCLCD